MSYAIRSCFCACTDNHSLTRHYSVSSVFKAPIWATQFAIASTLVQTHQPDTIHQELTVLSWRLQGFLPWFETQLQPNCLFESHSDLQVSYQHRALYKLFKIYRWITCGKKFNKYSKIHLFQHSFPIISFSIEKDG